MVTEMSWTEDASRARRMVDDVTNDFDQNPVREPWQRLFEEFKGRLTIMEANNKSREIMQELAVLSENLFQSMPARERWQDAVVYIKNSLALVSKALEQS